MPIPVECPHCLANLQVKESFVGKRIPCRECGKPFQVARSARRGSAGGGRKRSSSGGGGKGILIGGIAVGAAVISGVIGFAAVRMLMGGGGGGGGGQPDGDFAPGGQTVNTTPNPVPVAGTAAGGSRFDLPVQGATSSNAPGAPSAAGPKNPSAGIGLGNVIGVTDFWKNRHDHTHGAEAEFELFSQEPDALPPSQWDVKADPPPAPIVFAPDRAKVQVKVPNNGRTGATPLDITFPVVPSAFVSVGQHTEKKDVREVWDLTRPEKVGTITDLGVETTMNALSPDGKYFAGATGWSKQSIGVWDVEAKAAIVDITPGDDMRSIDFLAIPRPDLLVAGSRWGKKIGVWELPSGNPLHEFDLGWSWMEVATIAFSPGGRYLVMPYRDDRKWDEEIGIFDLERGEVAGSFPPPVYATWRSFRLDPQGFAFSPDGTELAGVFNGHHASKVFIWRLSDGAVVDHMTFPKVLGDIALGEHSFAKKALPLIWFPGNQRLIAYETTLLDRKLKTNVYQIPGGDLREKFPGLRRPIDESHITVLTVKGRDGFVSVYEIPEEQVSKAAARVAERVNRQPDVPVHLVEQEMARGANWGQVKWIAPQAVSWSVQPDPSPPAASGARSCELAMLRGTLRQVGLSQTGEPRAVALRSTAHDPFGRTARGNKSPDEIKSHRWFSRPSEDGTTAAAGGIGNARAWIDVYDLSAGKRTGELRLPYDGDLLAVSPDAARCLILENGEEGRIDVYETVNGSHVAGFVPYSRERDELAKLLVAASLPDADHALTLSGAGQLVGWDLAEARATFAAQNASQPSSSPGGRYAGYCDGQAYYFVELASGALVGRVPDVSDVQAVAWHPGGARVALLSSHAAAYYLFTIDVASGAVSPPFPVPVISGHLRWFGDRYVLLDHSKLIDVDQKVVAWTYALPAGDHLPMAPDDRHWFVADNGGKPLLDVSAVPDRQAQSQLSGASLAPEFVLQPGGTCSLSLQLNHAAIDASARQQIEKLLRDQLAKNKITVANGQPVTLQVTVSETVGQTVEREYSAIGRGTGSTKVSFALKTAKFHVAFLTGGQTAWEWTSHASNDQWFVSHKENESIPDVLERNYQASIKRGFDGVMLPPYVFSPTSANGLGTTELSRAR